MNKFFVKCLLIESRILKVCSGKGWLRKYTYCFCQHAWCVLQIFLALWGHPRLLLHQFQSLLHLPACHQTRLFRSGVVFESQGEVQPFVIGFRSLFAFPPFPLPLRLELAIFYRIELQGIGRKVRKKSTSLPWSIAQLSNLRGMLKSVGNGFGPAMRKG